MIAGDVILSGITPTVGLYPNSRPDPLGDYFETLERVEELAPRIAYTGHRDPSRTRWDGRARSARTIASGSTAPSPRSTGRRCPPTTSRSTLSRRAVAGPSTFATAESLAHLERLVDEGRASGKAWSTSKWDRARAR